MWNWKFFLHSTLESLCCMSLDFGSWVAHFRKMVEFTTSITNSSFCWTDCFVRKKIPPQFLHFVVGHADLSSQFFVWFLNCGWLHLQIVTFEPFSIPHACSSEISRVLPCPKRSCKDKSGSLSKHVYEVWMMYSFEQFVLLFLCWYQWIHSS